MDDFENLEDEALLLTINAVGKKGNYYFEDFLKAIQNDSIPKFVMLLLNISSIENVIIQDCSSVEITEDQIKNIDAVIEYLKKIEVKFRFLLFNFTDTQKRISSAKVFYSNLLDAFFLKAPKIKMYERCSILINNKIEFKDQNNFSELCSYEPFLILLHFLTKKNLSCSFPVQFQTDYYAEIAFNDAKIPKIINNAILKIAKERKVSNTIFYQLQFIFDVFDSKFEKFQIFETFFRVISQLRKVKIPHFKTIKYSIKVKNYDITKIQKKKIS